MGDLDAHLSMKDCCRETLGKLDKICSTVTGKSDACTRLSLVNELSNLPIPVAMHKIENRQIIAERLAGSVKPLSESLGDDGIKLFNDICKEHEKTHRDKKENREAAFWALLRGEIEWLPYRVETGTATYYEDRYKDFKRRHPDLTPPSYYLDYGKKYYDRFKTEVRPKLSAAGQQWVDDVAKKLQEKMEAKVGNTISSKVLFDTLERDDAAFTAFAYSTHCSTYDEAGIGKLPPSDVGHIWSAPDWKDLLSKAGLEQAACVVEKNPMIVPKALPQPILLPPIGFPIK